jgi:hypothetical protein
MCSVSQFTGSDWAAIWNSDEKCPNQHHPGREMSKVEFSKCLSLIDVVVGLLVYFDHRLSVSASMQATTQQAWDTTGTNSEKQTNAISHTSDISLQHDNDIADINVSNAEVNDWIDVDEVEAESLPLNLHGQTPASADSKILHSTSHLIGKSRSLSGLSSSLSSSQAWRAPVSSSSVSSSDCQLEGTRESQHLRLKAKETLKVSLLECQTSFYQSAFFIHIRSL